VDLELGFEEGAESSSLVIGQLARGRYLVHDSFR
jgi:hypothetical protein